MKKTIICSVVVLLVLVGCLSNNASGSNVLDGFQDTKPELDDAKVTVSGTAKELIKADLVSFVVEIQAQDAYSMSEAQRKNSEISNNVKDALISTGVDESEISTSSYTMWDSFDYNKETGESTFKYHKVSHNLKVKTDNIEAIGRLFDDAIANGATRITALQWSLKEDTKSEVEKRLFARALENAKSKVFYAFPEGKNFSVVEVTEMKAGGRWMYAPGYTFGAGGYYYDTNEESDSFSVASIDVSSTVSAIFVVSG